MTVKGQMQMNYDVIIIGAGPAGVSAGIYAKSRGLNCLLLEKKCVGGIISNVSSVTHYASVEEGETGEMFSQKMINQLERTGVAVQYEDVKSVKLNGDVKEVTTENTTYQAKSVIIANGSTPRRLDIVGSNEHYGKTMGLNPFKHGPLHKGKDMFVIGGADGAVKEAIFLSQFAKTVTIVCVENEIACIKEFKDKLATIENIKIRPHSGLVEVHGGDSIEALVFEDLNSGEKEKLACEEALVFVYAGLIPNTHLYDEFELENGYIKTNSQQETSIKGVYAAGDICVKQVRQIATAVSDGAVAGIQVAGYLTKLL